MKKTKPHIEVANKYIKVLKNLGVEEEQDPKGSTEWSHLLWMLEKINKDDLSSETKANRWLGFIQGCLIKDNVISLQEEREKTREIFDGL